MVSDANCIFCKIIAGEIPCHKIGETELSIAILDAFPVTRGHSLVLPKNHSANFMEMGVKETADAAELMKRMAAAIVKATGAEAVNLLSNVGARAGQVVFHSHFHIIPRYENDNLEVRFRKTVSMDDAEKAELLESIKSELK